MSRWPTILLGLLAVGAIVFLAIYEPLTRSVRERHYAQLERAVLNLDPGRVTQIRIVSGESDVVFRRKGDGWQLGEKSKDRADSAEVRRLLETASRLQYLDRIDGGEIRNDEDLARFGLRNPKRRIEFHADRKMTLYLGKDGASEDRLYARTDDGRDVYLLSDQILRQAFRPAGDFRDRRLTDLTPDRIDRVMVRRADGEIELVRDARGWQIARPLHVAADEARVMAFLNALLSLRVAEWVGDDSGDLTAFGIAEGQKEITFLAEGSDRPQTLRFGSDGKGVLYGQFTARDSVYRLPSEAAELLKITPADLRDRRLLPVNLDIVDRIRIASPDGTVILQRAADGWELKTGAETAPASEAAIQALANAVTTATVTGYTPASAEKLSAAGLADPPLIVEFLSVLSENTPEARAGEQVVASVAFGRPQGETVAARTGDSPEIASVDAGLLAVIPTDAAAWRAPK